MENFKLHSWTRYWHLRGEPPELGADGYVYDPQGVLGRHISPKLLSINGLPQRVCTILLGERGAGKSVEARLLADALGARFVDLGSISSDDDLDREVFAPLEASLKDSANPSVYVLDGFDEALFGVPNLAKHFARRVQQLQLNARWYITCRTAAWPISLENQLAAHFGKESLSCYELAPLLKRDVETAGQTLGHRGREFLALMEGRHLQALASRPITLKMLLSTFSTSNQLSSSMVDLYEQSLLLACEQSDERRDNPQQPSLAAGDGLCVAARIAAALLLTNRRSIFQGSLAEAQSTDLVLDDLVGGSEVVSGNSITVTRPLLDSTLRQSGLFTSRGPMRFGFAHKSYAEFLAARYLKSLDLKPQQLRSLLLTDEAAPQLRPQLQETCAWLASMDVTFLELILDIEPEALLLGDPDRWNDELRRSLVDRILSRIERRQLHFSAFLGFRQYLKRLSYPKLGEQLRPLCISQTISGDVRLAAIEIAEMCESAEVADTLADLVLCATEAPEIRKAAAYALRAIDLPEATVRLKPLLQNGEFNDPNHDLRGIALMALWPAHIGTAEMLAALKPVGVRSRIGSYEHFFYGNELANRIPVNDLHIALEWATSIPNQQDDLDPLVRLSGEVAFRAWRDGPSNLMAQIAKLVWKRLCDRAPAFLVRDTSIGRNRNREEVAEALADDPAKRRSLVAELMRLVPNERELHRLRFIEPSLVSPADMPWLVEQACAASGTEARMLARLALDCYDGKNVAHTCKWLDAREHNSTVREVFQIPLVVEIGSAQAAAMKSDFEKYHRPFPIRQRRARTPEPTASDLAEQSLKGNLGLFVDLAIVLSTSEDGQTPYFPDEIASSPGWIAADAELRDLIKQAAIATLFRAPLNPIELLEADQRFVFHLAPGLAARLIYQLDRQLLDTISTERWEQLAPYIFEFDPTLKRDERDDAIELVRLAHLKAPDPVREAAISALNRARGNQFFPHTLENFLSIPDSTLDGHVLDLIRDGTWHPSVRGTAMRWLLARGHAESKKWVREIAMASPSADADDENAIEAALALMDVLDENGWKAIWPRIRGEREFGRRAIEKYCSEHFGRSSDLCGKLSDESNGALLHWLYLEYPPSENDFPAGAHSPSAVEMVARLRLEVMNHLVNRGSRASVAAIQSLEAAHPEYAWLRAHTLDAERAWRTAEWNPPTPRELLRIVSDANARFIASEEQLLELICESLKRLEAKLHGPTPLCFVLWNQIPPTPFRPKSEEELSDYVAHHLSSDIGAKGVVVNREVQIRRRSGKAMGIPGEDTDIHVEAISSSRPNNAAHERLTVIIETKGCWNREVQTAMESQLAGRYLANNPCRHGLFLVGWFVCDHWDHKDGRNSRTPWSSIADARKSLEQQAAALSGSLQPPGTVKAFVLDVALR